jgi:hypothetical protein
MTLAEMLAEIRQIESDLSRWRISLSRLGGASAQGRLQASQRVRFLEFRRQSLTSQVDALQAEAA